MAEALFNHYAEGEAHAFSAGTHPASHVDRNVVEATKEMGFGIRSQRPKMLTLDTLDGMDKIITMGCGVERVHPATFIPAEEWGLEDPEGKPMEKVREIRDEIEARVKKLIHDIKQEGR